ncbi:MAG: VanW family protein [Anaerotignum sp.]|nr:VanW family protein [Anaerotignum sp.]
MGRKLFCEISPLTYEISRQKCILMRRFKNFIGREAFSKAKSLSPLPNEIFSHASLMRRRLGNVNMALQENKVSNLSLAVPLVDGILIRPGETFSFWKLVGNTSLAKGYKMGLSLEMGCPSQDIGGGMCQFTNLIHWMVLHTPLTIMERHHHDQLDLFPDFHRQVPFGLGTSIVYNYFDYQFKNNTTATYQIFVSIIDEYLCGEIRANQVQPYLYHVYAENEFFSKEEDGVYRNGNVYRETINAHTQICNEKSLLQKNHAKVTYDTTHLKISE